jgi:type II secretory pathway pseudopilin PulG
VNTRNLKRPTHHTARRRRVAVVGITLIELLVSMVLVGIILAAASMLLLQSFASEATYRQQNSAQQNARKALDAVADDLRGAERVSAVITMGTVQATMPSQTVRGTTAGNATPANISSSASPLYFNIFNDNSVQRRVRYWLNGTDLRREVVDYVDEATTGGAATSATAGMIIARNVSTFTAQKPYDSQSASDPRLNNYNIVRVIIATTEGTAGSQSQVQLRADIVLRNNLL